MQATLLGISVAIILALVAALVGPHFVDWTQYRARFESEATRLAGMPVRIAGPIDVSLLPTPTLMLGRVEFGAPAQPQGKARELYAELALGALVKGEFRASELRVTGPEVSLGLAANGRIDWPAARMGFDPDQLQIEKVSFEDGRVVFSDGASGTRAALEGVWFKGDLRSLLGPVKGEGGFTSAGERYGYRISSGRRGDDGTMKLKLGLDPVNQPLAIEADGTLRFDDSSPHFDGMLTVSRPVVAAAGRGAVAVPWRASAKVKAEPARALFEQIEYTYGPEASAIRLTGTAEFRFGKNPRVDSLLSARQVDIDRALALPDGARRLPLASLKAFLEPFASSYRPTVPVRLGIGVDAVTLAGGTLQSLRGDLKLDGNGWDIETLEMRAPGFAQVRLSGRMAQTADGISFKGPANVEANEPRMFAAWLEGRSDALSGPSGVLRVGGDLTVGAQEFAVERLKFEFDRKAVEGRFAYAGASGAKPPRLDAELKAAELDVDGMMAFGRAALDGTAIEWPREVSVAVDVARATVAGIDVKGVSGTFKLDPAGVTFDRVRIADLADASFSLNGRMEGALDAPRGTVTFDVDARGLDGTVAVLEKFLPQVAEPVRQASAKITPLKARATLAIEPVSSTNLRGDSKVKLALEGTGGALRMKFNAEAAGDIAALTLPEFRLDGQIAATDGAALTSLLGLDRALNVDKRPGALNVAIRSAAGGDATLDARITAGGLSASAIGTARLFSASGLSTTLDLTLRSADAGPLRRGVAGAPVTLLPVALSAKLNATANDFALDGLNGSVGSTPVRGKLKLSLAPAKTIDGQIDLDFLDAGALIAAAAGMPKSARADAAKWPSEPFVESGLGDFSGRIQFNAKRASLTPTLSGQHLRGAVRFGSGEIAFEDIEGTLAGGRANGQLVLRRGPDGLATRMKFALAGADATAMLPSEGRPAVSGRLGLSAELEGNGLSPASLVGSLTGSGTIALEDAQIASLDPRAFSAAISAADRGMAIDTPRIRDIVATMLDGGALVVPRLDAAFAVNAGQARTGPVLIYAQGANLNLLANADLAESTFDARMTLFGPSVSEGANTTRPEILVTLKGPLAAPKRTVDVAALSAWLMLRSVERQAKHIDAIEAERRDFERREAERREAERRDAERREAERKEAERREAEARAITSTVPAALPAPAIINEERSEPPARIQRPRTTAPRVVEPAAPALPPPLSIGPAPGANAKSAPRPVTGQGGQIPPPPPRSSLDTLFGLQR